MNKKVLFSAVSFVGVLSACSSGVKLVTMDEPRYNNDYGNYHASKPESNGLVTMNESKYNNDYANSGSTPRAKSESVAHNAPAKTARDSDSDGIADDVDQCANTPSGVKVNSLGCPMDQAVEMKIDIQFDNGKSAVKPQYNDELKKMADLLNHHQDLGAEIQGHTDNMGKEATNLKLSDARAKAVKAYLSDKLGVKWDHLTGKGYGSSKPIADNATAEGREKNRRVVAVIRSLESVKTLKAKKKADEAAAEKNPKKN